MYSVCVVMSSYNGEKFLQDQLDSIFSQNNIDVILYVRDDGSTDGTISILEKIKHPKFYYQKGVNLGAKRSFLEAIRSAPKADYYALADQDDVWDKDKLFSAINQLKNKNNDTPLLYCSALRVVDEQLRTTNNKKSNSREYSFLCGDILPAAGCTMVFNNSMKNKLCKYNPVTYPMHDYWILLLCLAIGGTIVYDVNPHIAYRQHEHNTVGGKRSICKSIVRRIQFYKEMGPNFHTKMYKEIIDAYSDDMPKENVDFCRMICRCNKSVYNRLLLIRNNNFWKGRYKWKMETAILLFLGLY